MLSKYDKNFLGIVDRIRIFFLKRKYNRGLTYFSEDLMINAHRSAEKIRNNNGYSGGIDGSGFILV